MPAFTKPKTSRAVKEPPALSAAGAVDAGCDACDGGAAACPAASSMIEGLPKESGLAAAAATGAGCDRPASKPTSKAAT